MTKNTHISNSEMQIMEYVWDVGRAVTTAEIMQNLPGEKNWSQKTVITFLARLIEKKVLKATRIGRAFHYEACITAREYRNQATKRFINDVHKGSVFGCISALCDSGNLTKEDIDAIRERIKELDDCYGD